MKNSNYVTGNRIRDLPVSSAVSPPTAPPFAPSIASTCLNLRIIIRLTLYAANHNTVRSESRCALRLRYVDLVVSIEIVVEVCCCFTVFSC
jgi:hypothetical protein